MRKISILGILAMLLTLALGACGDATATPGAVATTAASSATTAAGSSTTAAAGAATTAASSGAPVKITWWTINTADPEKGFWQSMADAYTKAHPNVTIEIVPTGADPFKTKLSAAMQAGTPPDIFQSWGGGVLQAYADAGLVKDLTSSMQGGWGDSFIKTALDVYTPKGKIYGVPWDMGAVGFFYNKLLFKQAGIANAPATWTEFLDTVKKLQAANIQPIALGNKDKWPGLFYYVYLAVRMGGKDAFDKAYNRTGTFADAPFVKAGEKLQELMALNPFPAGYQGLVYADQAALFGNGKAAIELTGQYGITDTKSNSANKQGIGDENLGYFPFPSVEGGAGDKTDVQGGGNGFAVGKNAPAEAIDFLKFITSAENQKTLTTKTGRTVTVTAARDSVPHPITKQIVEMVGNAKYFQLYYDQYLPPAVGEAVKDASQGIFAKTLSAEAAAKLLETSAATELAKK